MLAGIKRDLESEASPWLGIASPMQTGKSTLTKPLIPMLEQLHGPDTRFITEQLIQDLLGDRDPTQVGRLDGLQKE